MPRIPKVAIQTALAKKGVAVVVIPGDVALSEAVNQARRVGFTSVEPVARGVHDELVALAGKLQAPIVHALRRKEFIEYDNPYDVGMTGLLGFSSGYHAMMNCASWFYRDK